MSKSVLPLKVPRVRTFSRIAYFVRRTRHLMSLSQRSQLGPFSPSMDCRTSGHLSILSTVFQVSQLLIETLHRTPQLGGPGPPNLVDSQTLRLSTCAVFLFGPRTTGIFFTGTCLFTGVTTTLLFLVAGTSALPLVDLLTTGSGPCASRD